MVPSGTSYLCVHVTPSYLYVHNRPILSDFSSWLYHFTWYIPRYPGSFYIRALFCILSLPYPSPFTTNWEGGNWDRARNPKFALKLGSPFFRLQNRGYLPFSTSITGVRQLLGSLYQYSTELHSQNQNRYNYIFYKAVLNKCYYKFKFQNQSSRIFIHSVMVIDNILSFNRNSAYPYTYIFKWSGYWKMIQENDLYIKLYSKNMSLHHWKSIQVLVLL